MCTSHIYWPCGLIIVLFAEVANIGSAYNNNATGSSDPPIGLQRHYVTTSAAGQGEHTTFVARFRLLSQNILAESWISTGVGRTVPFRELLWEERLARLWQEVERRNPDVITLQEVEQAAFNADLRPRALVFGFDGVFSTKSGQPIGVAIFWRLSKFDVDTAIHADLTDASQSRWYVEIAFGFSPEQIDRYLRTARRTTLFVVLVPRSFGGNGRSRHAIVVGTTHLISTFHELPTNLDVQVFQAVRTMEALETVIAQQEARTNMFDGVSVILSGDFNAPPHYPASVISMLEGLINHAAIVAEDDAEPLQDNSEHCNAWAAAGECLQNPSYMLIECFHACKGAGITLEERRRLLCDFWVSRGDCTTQAEQMNSRCPTSCNLHGDATKGVTSVTTSAPATPPWVVARSPVYELFTRGHLSQDSIAFLAMAVKATGLHPSSVLPLPMLLATWKGREMVSAYAEALGTEPATCLKETIDYVFFSPGSRNPVRLTLLGVLAPPQRPLSYAEAIRTFGSDHVPLVSDFVLA